MAISFAKVTDDAILEHVRDIGASGADVTLTTTEVAGTEDVTHRVVIEWQTHNARSYVLRI